MSGGFFRGTSADQDTRFSNKHAKLLKSQKFAPELEHLVDMTKVSMDVMKPWIANRVTELLGFEDEVLINFIYGLLEGKVVNGKEIQISLTGFMEKNTVKFMKELWTLLISAQNNATGVPQQFLDAKQEEARIKKEEADKLASEIQKRRDKERIDQQELLKKMEGGVDKKASNVALEPNSKHVSPRDRPEDERGAEKRNGVNARNRISRSPNSDNSSLSRERNRSKSVSRSPKERGRSISSERGYRSPARRPTTTLRRRSPDGSLSPRGRRRSRSRSPQRSMSPYLRKFRSPYRRRSPSPFRRRRSPPPVRRRRSPSPFRRRRSPSPVRRRRSPSPVRRRRSPSLVRRRRSPSPVRRRRSRSPVRRRSPSPVRRSYRRSPLPSRNRYASPMQRRSLVRGGRRSPTPLDRSPSPERSSSSPVQYGSLSPVRGTKKPQRSPSQSPEERTRSLEKFSPRLRESKNENDSRKRATDFSPSPEKPRIESESPPGRSASEERSPYDSPVRRPRKQMTRDVSSSPPRKPLEQKLRRGSPKLNDREDEHRLRSVDRRSKSTLVISKAVISSAKVPNKEEYSPERVASGHRSPESLSRLDNMEFRNKDQEMKSRKSSGRGIPEATDHQKASTMYKDSLSDEVKQVPYPDDKNHSHSKSSKDSDQHRKPGSLPSSTDKVNHSNRSGTLDSGSDESGKHRGGDKEKRKTKRSERQEVTSDDSSDSEVEGRKDTKRRRKEEKRLRKEKKRRKREERRRRKEERRAEKLKGKNYSDASASDDEHGRRDLHSSDKEETEAQKKLEIELRNKALESLNAKKGINQ